MSEQHTYLIIVKGLVQGVGFRPFIYKLATQYGLNGWVENRNDGVFINTNAVLKILQQFIHDIRTKAPTASKILNIDYRKIKYTKFVDFNIKKSVNTSMDITQISPDIAICDNCLADLTNQSHRIDYPFTNCTNCGPRFSIIKDLPYDRKKTTMQAFEMCNICTSEYNEVTDRRFHAQPIACNHCGPTYALIINGLRINNYQKILSKIVDLIQQGRIIAVKGMGGFHLMCDAFNIESVQLLRQKKLRENKAFAVLFSDIGSIEKYAFVSPKANRMLVGWKRPIVILPYKKIFNPHISNGLNTIGVMLPYTAFHYQLFKKIDTPAVVLTSANISDCPIIIEEKEAIKELSNITDAFLVYNREIHNRCDDSVGMVVNNKKRIIRRSRGYVPIPFFTKGWDVEGIVAVGAELSNCFAIGRKDEVLISQHIGDLKNFETYAFYKESMQRFEKLFRIKKKLIVSDLHPDYLSSQWALQAAEKETLPLVKVQHHHAHIAACMGEHRLDEKVMGISFDGTGLGDDGSSWGGEFLICDLNEYKRISHFENLPLPGGDKVSKEPWRMAISYLYSIYGKDFIKLQLPVFQYISKKKISIIQHMIDCEINTPTTSSVGRLFDAVAAICGICYINTFQAEAPMRLEASIDKTIVESYDYKINDMISVRPMVKQIVKDIENKKDIGFVSAKFHRTIVLSSLEMVQRIAQKSSLNRVVFSGGVFQNRYLLTLFEDTFRKSGFDIFSHQHIPSNDGGIAFGQILIAAKQRKLGLI